jgi:hypothetical protein
MKRLLFLIVVLTACGQKTELPIKRFEIIDSRNGTYVFLDNQQNHLLYINQSNRIYDIIPLSLNRQEIQKIKIIRDSTNAKEKYKDWGEIGITGTNYQIALRTRFYNDQLLYVVSMTPYDLPAYNKCEKISIIFYDTRKFILYQFYPQNWAQRINKEGKTIAMVSDGSFPFKLDNYIEIDSWNIMWDF